MQFTKMHGLGNDYLYIYAQELPENAAELSRTYSSRHFGVGSDGIIWILPSSEADFAMRIFNADGSQAQMCGNGIRCVGKYVHDKGLTSKDAITISTLAGIKSLKLQIDEASGTTAGARVDMGTSHVGKPVRPNIEAPGLPAQSTFYPVDMGNPHAVVFCDDAQGAPVEAVGRQLQESPLFPEGVNVEFVQVIAPDELRMRVWERGSGITLACGTGSCASVAAAVSLGICPAATPVTVHLDGGDLRVCVQEGGRVSMEGPAAFVCEGSIEEEGPAKLAPGPINTHYLELKDSYLFRTIDRKVSEYLQGHPDAHLLRLGIGDVTRPLCPAVIKALHSAVDDQASTATFQGYQSELGAPFLRQAIANHYAWRGVRVSTDEVFVSSGASDDLGDILNLFRRGIDVAVIEPAYPAYVDANIMEGNHLVHLPASAADGFAPLPPADLRASLVYLCSPNNPTGAVYSREKLAAWVSWACAHDATIIFDAAYEAFIQEEGIPHSIYEIPHARECAIEICSLSKTAGFTGTRCGYTIVPMALERQDAKLNALWERNRTTKTNGISYILQRGAAAVFTEEGQCQIAESIAAYQENARTIMDALDACGIWYCGGKNAPYVWMKAPDKLGSWELFDLLLAKAQVVGTPGAGFGECGEGFFRLTAFGNPQDTKEAARRIRSLFS